MSSHTRYSYSSEAEAAVNLLINLYLQASYTYLSLGVHFSREDVALEGTGRVFHELADEKHKDTEKLLKMQKERGGCVVFQDVQKPAQEEWRRARDAMEAATVLESNLKQALCSLYALASIHSDVHLRHFLESRFVGQEVKLLEKMRSHLTNLRRPAATHPGLGECLFDRLSLKQKDPEPSRP